MEAYKRKIYSRPDHPQPTHPHPCHAGIKMFYGPDTYYGEEVSVLEMDGQVGGRRRSSTALHPCLSLATMAAPAWHAPPR